ncbi:hypothetical protein J2Z60_001318 [Lactobacillus colini]|uniref:Bacteriocin immunity protein n=1 Tax=Lactobacillus colini TaxID=1819254 RepID=A0ABS4MFM4_9LACO|nr:bacteriocin immunity protein [Lactobacillus colini]MBP2058141.1 hypothetical protein [Lactobacillus colini]
MEDKLSKTVKQFTSVTAKQSSIRENNIYLLNLLKKTEEKLSKNPVNDTDIARYLYQEINTTCLVNKIKLTNKELALLDKIKEISQQDGWLGRLNSFNTTNGW